MLKKDLILRNPLRHLEYETEDILPEGGFGAILSRAGVGKTALLVQLALNNMLRNKNILHISLTEPVKKVGLWYESALRNIAAEHHIQEIHKLWEAILPHRFIMSFRVEGFTVPKLEERLTDLSEQGIFFPQMVLVDGLPFEDATDHCLKELKEFARAHALHVWFAVRTHQDDEAGDNEIPQRLSSISDLFEVVIMLQPEGKQIHVRLLKGRTGVSAYRPLFLDPSTMLIKEAS
jgi:hypothetical protein